MSGTDTRRRLFAPVPRSCLEAGGEWDELEAARKLRELVLRLRGGAADASSCEGDKGLEWREGEGEGEGEGKVPGLTWDSDVKGRELSIEGAAGLKFRERSDEGEFEGAGDDLDGARSPCVILLPMCAAKERADGTSEESNTDGGGSSREAEEVQEEKWDVRERTEGGGLCVGVGGRRRPKTEGRAGEEVGGSGECGVYREGGNWKEGRTGGFLKGWSVDVEDAERNQGLRGRRYKCAVGVVGGCVAVCHAMSTSHKEDTEMLTGVFGCHVRVSRGSNPRSSSRFITKRKAISRSNSSSSQSKWCCCRAHSSSESHTMDGIAVAAEACAEGSCSPIQRWIRRNGDSGRIMFAWCVREEVACEGVAGREDVMRAVQAT